MFTKTYQLDALCKKDAAAVHPGDLFHVLNDVMRAHTASIGLDHHYHAQRNLMWVLTAYDLELNHMPQDNMALVAKTAPYAFKKMYGYRRYELTTLEGVHIGTAKGRFVLVDTVSEQLTVPDETLLKRFDPERREPAALPMFKPPALPVTPPEHRQEIVVTSAHIDVNGHVNNAFYPEWAWSHFPAEVPIFKGPIFIHVQFKREVFIEETVSLDYHSLEAGWDIVMRKGDTLVARVIILPA